MGNMVYQRLDNDKSQIRLLRLYPKLQWALSSDLDLQSILEQTKSQLAATQGDPNPTADGSADPNRTISSVQDLASKMQSLKAAVEEPHPRQLPLNGELEIVPLASAPNFVALSYVWGPEADKVPFILGGAEVQITNNLAIALRHLQHDTQQTLLWIDALCSYSHRTRIKHLRNPRLEPQFMGCLILLI